MDQTGEFTGELIFDGQMVTRALGSNYDDGAVNPGEASDGEAQGGSTKERTHAVWALSPPASPDAETEYAGINAGLLYRGMRAARDVIVEFGFEHLFLNAIQKRGSLTTAEINAIAVHFEDGDAMAAALIQKMHTPNFRDLSEAAITTGPVPEAIATILDRLVEYRRRDLPLFRKNRELLYTPLPHNISPRTTKVLHTIDRRGVQIFAAILAEGQMRGEIRVGDPEVLARGIVACVSGLLASMNSGTHLLNTGVYADDLLNELLSMMLDGLTLR